MSSAPVVISGLGIVSSIGIGPEAFWDGLVEGRSGVQLLAGESEPERPEAAVWVGAPVTDFQPKLFIKPRKAMKVMCHEIQLAFAASTIAMTDAEFEPVAPDDGSVGGIPADRVGTVFGSEMFYGSPEEMQDAFEASLVDGQFDPGQFGNAAAREITPLWMLKYLPNMPACHVGISIGALGPNNSLVVGDVSAHSALIESESYLHRGIADMVVCGAVGTRINTTRLNYRGDYPIAQLTSPVHHMARPFGDSPSGVVGGEGAAAVIVETQTSAHRRSRPALASVAAAAARFAPGSLRRSDPSKPIRRGSATAIGNAIDAALAQAGLEADKIDLVVSHAMGDPEMDAAEREAITRRLPDPAVTCPTIAAGHSGAACGMLGVVTGVLALVHQTVPPTVNAESVDGVRVSPQAFAADLRHALCLSHTSEGAATAVILRRHGESN